MIWLLALQQLLQAGLHIQMRKNLFEPYQLAKNFKLKNRLVMAPMTTWSGRDDGQLSDAEYQYYQMRSHGVGMVITATSYLQPHGKGFSGQFYAGSDDCIESLSKLSKTIQSAGAKAILQLFHAGRKANPNLVPNQITFSASAVPGKREDHTPKEMSEQEIKETIQSFYEGTKRAYMAGFDGIEIHGANTYLVQQFFSPHSNRRNDHWGGSLENRLRFPIEIVNTCFKALKELQIKDTRPFIIGYRLSPEENSEPGIVFSDTKMLIEALCQTQLDYLHVSLSKYNQLSIREQKPDEDNHGMLLNRMAQWINGRKPFIGVGSVFTRSDAEKALSLGSDLVALGRQLIIDPNTIEKWERNLEAFEAYVPSQRSILGIPEEMETVLLSREGWLNVAKGSVV